MGRKRERAGCRENTFLSKHTTSFKEQEESHYDGYKWGTPGEIATMHSMTGILKAEIHPATSGKQGKSFTHIGCQNVVAGSTLSEVAHMPRGTECKLLLKLQEGDTRLADFLSPLRSLCSNKPLKRSVSYLMRDWGSGYGLIWVWGS